MGMVLFATAHTLMLNAVYKAVAVVLKVNVDPPSDVTKLDADTVVDIR